MEFSKTLIIYLLFLNLFTLSISSKFLANTNDNISNDNSTVIPETLNNVLVTFDGFSNTSGIYNNLPSFENVKLDEYTSLQEFFMAYQIFKDINKDNFVDTMISGSGELSSLFKRVATIVSNSLNLGNELKELSTKIESTLKNKEYYKNLLLNLVSYNIFDIFELIQKIQNDIVQYIIDLIYNNSETKNYYDLGQNMGKLFKAIFVLDTK